MRTGCYMQASEKKAEDVGRFLDATAPQRVCTGGLGQRLFPHDVGAVGWTPPPWLAVLPRGSGAGSLPTGRRAWSWGRLVGLGEVMVCRLGAADGPGSAMGELRYVVVGGQAWRPWTDMVMGQEDGLSKEKKAGGKMLIKLRRWEEKYYSPPF